jgi:hypothetical protein
MPQSCFRRGRCIGCPTSLVKRAEKAERPSPARRPSSLTVQGRSLRTQTFGVSGCRRRKRFSPARNEPGRGFAVTGLVAGALSAAVFAVHQAGSSIPFIALWYGGPIVVCAFVGAVLGPRLLRW